MPDGPSAPAGEGTGEDTADAAPRGFVLGASGRSYTTLAEAACASMKAAMPDLPVDLYSDCDPAPGLFDRVHPLRKSWFRPKFEALLRTRFERTIYLDVDIRVIAPIADVFEVLDRFDLAAAHVQNRNQSFAIRPWRDPVPPAFPQINGGLIGIRRSPAVTALLSECLAAMEAEGLTQDQPVFRQMLWQSELRLAILPPEYNARSVQMWRFGSSNLAAPRVLHHSAFHKRMRHDRDAPAPWRIYGPLFMRHVSALLGADRTLNPQARGSVPAPNDLTARFRRLLPRWKRR